MEIKNYGSDEIYGDILKQVDALIENLNNDYEDEVINIAQQDAYKILKNYKAIIEDEYSSLQKYSEWDKFTVAFYGETNAGKSTCIEVLRILLNERTKSESIEKFKEIQSKENITQEAFDKIRSEIMQLEDYLETLQKKKENIYEEYTFNSNNLKEELEELKQRVDEIVSNRNLWQKILAFFITSEEERILKSKQKAYAEYEKDYKKQNENVDNEISSTKDKFQTARAENERLKKSCIVLEPYKDGAIIGDGRSDYTKINSTYHFSLNGVDFDLVDVPGIEGNEGIIKDSIMEAVKKAHAVFYVTRKPTAPQSVDGKNGTLEKIKCHLGEQTEVWTIFNQSINNPARFVNPLISDDEKESLANMDTVIANNIGVDHYKGTISLSAYPAFLAIAECLVPGSKAFKNKEKFLKRYNKEEILNFSGVTAFLNQLPHDIIGDWKHKIVKANYNKAAVTLDNSIQVIENISKNFNKTERDLKRQYNDSCRELDSNMNILRNNIDNYLEFCIGRFSSNVRNTIYEEIDDGIGNDNFKYRLKKIMEDEQEKLIESVKVICEEETNNFRDSITEILEKAKKNIGNLLDNVSSLAGAEDINLKIDIDNGLDLWGVAGTIAGSIALIFSSGGIAIVGAVITIISSLYKALRSFFSSSYKKEQQRKSADENIRKVTADIRSKLQDSMSGFYPKLDNIISDTKKNLEKPVTIVIKINENLDRSLNKLNNMVKNIKGAV